VEKRKKVLSTICQSQKKGFGTVYEGHLGNYGSKGQGTKGVRGGVQRRQMKREKNFVQSALETYVVFRTRTKKGFRTTSGVSALVAARTKIEHGIKKREAAGGGERPALLSVSSHLWKKWERKRGKKVREKNAGQRGSLAADHRDLLNLRKSPWKKKKSKVSKAETGKTKGKGGLRRDWRFLGGRTKRGAHQKGGGSKRKSRGEEPGGQSGMRGVSV